MTGSQSPWVELRIHGVSGTPPEDMLDAAHVCQVAGDEFSRYFRPCDAAGNQTRPAPDHILEGYHWGKFTSGSWRQGLWLVILPFGFVNAAQFMLAHPTSRTGRSWHAVAGAMLRLLGLGLTATLILGVAVVTMDLTAWQWAPIHDLPVWTGMPGWPLAAAMLVCVGVLAVLFSFGRRLGGTSAPSDRADGRSPRGHRATVAPDSGPGPEGCAPDNPKTELGREAFFLGDTDSPALRKLHLATGLALVALLGAASGKSSNGPDTAVFWCFWIAIALIVALSLIVTFLGDPERTVTTMEVIGWFAKLRAKWHAVVSGVATGFALVSGLDLVLAIWLAGRRETVEGRTGVGLPGVDGTAFWVLVICVIAMLILFLSNGILAAATRKSGSQAPPAPFERFAMGMTPALVASIGTFVAVGYAAALPFAWAWILGRGDGPDYEVTPLLQRIAYSWGLTFVLIVGLALAALISYARRRAEFVDRATAAFTFGVEHQSNQHLRIALTWVGRVARAMWIARLKNSLQLVFWIFAVFGVVMSLAAGAEFLWSGKDGTDPFDLPGPLGALSADTAGGGAGVVITIGTLVLIALAAGLIFLGRGAIRQESARRAVNVAWDVIAFWPRSTHPFVPPPYSQRAVADLRARISWHLATPLPGTDDAAGQGHRPARHVVVAAHSQGSLIALAALLWLPAEERDRVGLVTFGSQLKVQFPRAFPAYVNFSVLEWLYDKFDARWVSLYRDTDPIAGPVLSWGHTPDRLDGVPGSFRIAQRDQRYVDEIDVRTGRRICGSEWRLLDPTPFDLAFQEGAIAKIRGHSHYPDDPDYPAALRAVFPPVPDPPGGPRHGTPETEEGGALATTTTAAAAATTSEVSAVPMPPVPPEAARGEAGALPPALS